MKTILTIEVVDSGDHYQIYKTFSDADGLGFRYKEKIGNITRKNQMFEADHPVYGLVLWQNIERAVAYLISPRGMM